MEYVSNPPEAFPNLLPLIFIEDSTAPVFEIAVKVPAVALLLRLLMILSFKLTIFTAKEFVIPTKIPVPELVPEITLLELISKVPEPLLLIIPLKTDAPVP